MFKIRAPFHLRLPLGLVSLVLATTAACTRAPATPDDPELRALLDDDELEGVIRQAQIVSDGGVSTGGAGGGTGGSGGSIGTDAAAPPDGGGMGGIGGGDPGCPGGAGGGMGGPGGKGGSAIDAGVARDAGGSGTGGGGGGCPVGPLGTWEMDDCSAERSDLRDSTFNGFTAFRSVAAKCVPGVEGSAVSLPGDKDLLYVPDQPRFTFQAGVTVATWLNPNRITGTQTIFRKREGTTSSVALMVVDKKYTFVIDRVGALPISVSAPAKKAGIWTHVAATYDGVDLRLYVNGAQAATLRRNGTIKGGEGPLLMANDGSHRRFDGAIDKVWFATSAASADTIKSLLCVHKPITMTGTPAMSMAVAPGTPVTFDLAINNPSSPECAPDTVQFSLNSFQPDFFVDPQFRFLDVPANQVTHIPVTITSGEDVEDGTFPFTFSAFAFNRFEPTGPAFATVNYVSQITGCHVSTRRELMIRDLSVVDDPIRTGFDAPASDSRRGVWTFKHLMEQLAPTAAQAPDVVEALLTTFTTPQTVNGFTIDARPGMLPTILEPWPRVNGKLDLARAPLRLLAIVNRMDLRNLDQGHAGEGRFIFNFLSPDGFPLEATLILEYHLPATTEAQVKTLANKWHALGALAVPSEPYNAALQAITDGFTKRGAAPGLPNGSALSQLRTNEIAFGGGAEWQLREFNLNAAGQLLPATIKLTPDRPTFDNTAALASWVNANEPAILAEQHQVPLMFQGAPFLTGSVFNDLGTWRADGITNPEARHKFALNTCNGCHSLDETGTFFLQVAGRFPGQEAPLSGFLTGITIGDPVTGEPRTFKDLSRRNADLKQMVCPPTATVRGGVVGPNLRRGIGRVH
jgi:hypothetical protein